MALSDLLQGCSNKSDIQSRYNKNVTRLTTQGCNNIVISRLYRTCWNNLATSLIISTRSLQVVNRLFQTCWQLGTSSANTTCRRLVSRLATRCEIFACVPPGHRPFKIYVVYLHLFILLMFQCGVSVHMYFTCTVYWSGWILNRCNSCVRCAGKNGSSKNNDWYSLKRMSLRIRRVQT